MLVCSNKKSNYWRYADTIYFKSLVESGKKLRREHDNTNSKDYLVKNR
jgi:hypothetical protein